MDKELIRIIIFAIGLLVILGMIAWSYLKHEKLKDRYDDYDDLAEEQEHSELGYSEESDIHELDEMDDYATARQPDVLVEADASEEQISDTASGKAIPAKKLAIIQFSLVARSEEGFSGTELFDILDDAGLEYGNLQIFERLDARRLVDFGVASMVKPGIFPSINLAAFHTPGIVFFMQPGKVDNPLAVFDDFVRTFQFVASQLGGEMWDQQREPLSEETIAQIRSSLDAS